MRSDRLAVFWAAVGLLIGFAIGAAFSQPAQAACEIELQGEGRVAEIVDARSLRLDDGREVRLLGIEPAEAARTQQALAAMIGNNVTLRGESDAPDRYGRQAALVFPQASAMPLQVALLALGHKLINVVPFCGAS